jgi:hypothetical protein
MPFNLFNKSCRCCDCEKGQSKWNKCLRQGKCPKQYKIKGNNVLTQNGGNVSQKMRSSRLLRTYKWNKACKCEIDIIKSKNFRCKYIDRYGNPLVSGPTMTLYGNITITDVSNVEFVDPGAKAYDHLSNSLKITRIISPSLIWNGISYTVGTYTFTYTAKDRFNQLITAERQVTFY